MTSAHSDKDSEFDVLGKRLVVLADYTFAFAIAQSPSVVFLKRVATSSLSELTIEPRL